MSLLNLGRRATRRRAARPVPTPPLRWPVDPELTRRATDTRVRIERTRRELARHVLPARRDERRSPEANAAASRHAPEPRHAPLINPKRS
jgi:hypothetical protein